ncbi:MAG: LppX_LprAFG lipoprotein [Chloroflexia bacterium]|nr:LppX_LprAFG lipoprotein [Chloroflexia bacterium]
MRDTTTFHLTRRRLLAMTGVSAVAAGLGHGRAGTAAQTPMASPTGDPEAVALLQEAARTMAELETFHFEMETVQGTTTLMGGLVLEGIEGDVRRPQDFRTEIRAGVPFGTVDVTVVGVEGRIWITDPLAGEETWILLVDGSAGGGNEAAEITTLANPDTLILEAVAVIQEARIGGQETIDGAETTRIDGTVDLAAAAQAAVGTPVALPPEVSPEPIPTSIWIDAQRRIIEVELAGPLLVSENADVIRVVRFTAFNEPVEIAPPENVAQ